MKHLNAICVLVALLFSGIAQAQNRYVEPPPVLVSPDLTAPWVRQLREPPVRVEPLYRQVIPRRVERRPIFQRRVLRRVEVPRLAVQAPRAAPVPRPRPVHAGFDTKYLPKVVEYDTRHGPGTIVIDTGNRFLYLVLSDGKAKRYGVGVGKPGFEWAGTHKVTQKREWPDWRPPASMIAREKKKGKILPAHVKGGPQNPLGARALYLGSTLYRIHGTNAPGTIGKAVSSGCIRMRNEDVIDLYERVPVGTKVVVI